jgi:hypothetical protein
MTRVFQQYLRMTPYSYRECVRPWSAAVAIRALVRFFNINGELLQYAGAGVLQAEAVVDLKFLCWGEGAIEGICRSNQACTTV